MKKTANYAAVVTLSLLIAVASYAGTWIPDWKLDSDISYEDNFFMDETTQDTWRYSVTPELSLIYMTPSVESSLNASIAVRRYSDLDGFDREDPSFSWDNSITSERNTWTFNFGYEEHAQRDRAELDTGQFDSNTIVERLYIEPGVVHRLSEKDSLGLSLRHIERSYDSDDFIDNESDSVAVTWEHQINRRWTTIIDTSISRYQADNTGINTTETDYSNITTGLVYQASEATSLDISIGYFNAEQQQSLLVGPALVITNQENSGVLASFGLISDQPVDDWRLQLNRGLYPSSQGDVEERDSVNFSYERQLTERSSAGVRAAYYDTKSEINARKSTEVAPFYYFYLTPRLKLETSYRYRDFDRELDTVESNRVEAGMRYSF